MRCTFKLDRKTVLLEIERVAVRSDIDVNLLSTLAIRHSCCMFWRSRVRDWNMRSAVLSDSPESVQQKSLVLLLYATYSSFSTHSISLFANILLPDIAEQHREIAKERINKPGSTRILYMYSEINLKGTRSD